MFTKKSVQRNISNFMARNDFIVTPTWLETIPANFRLGFDNNKVFVPTIDMWYGEGYDHGGDCEFND